MKKIVKFSKSYDNKILKIKKDFYLNNKKNLNSILKINKIYKKQVKRNNCQNCEKKLSKVDFKSFGVDYVICKKCSHLNGRYKITNKFSYQLYKGSKSRLYSLNYKKDYLERVENIYKPKVRFLKQTIGKNFTLTDIGSGGGHFLKACEIEKVKSIGYETSDHLVKLASNFLINNKIKIIEPQNINKIIQQSKSDCISLIGVLEHLANPNLAIESFIKSKSTFLYISVPLFSLSSYLEHANQEIFPRQLSGGHTHLYTKDSLYYLFKKNKLNVIGEWWFGTDIPDLYRTLINKFSKKNNSMFFIKNFDHFFTKHINELQNILDKHKICSEVHMILKKNK